LGSKSVFFFFFFKFWGPFPPPPPFLSVGFHVNISKASHRVDGIMMS
jgi:hypothetical protein